MMATETSLLERELECPICCEEISQPKIIGDCQHSFCQECLESLVSEDIELTEEGLVKCPVCRLEWVLPDRRVENLKDNFKLRSIVETHRQMKESHSNGIVCGTSGCKSPAVNLCLGCGEVLLCQRCTNKHDADTARRQHVMTPICSTHGGQLAFFCNDCKRLVCKVCVLSQHRSDGHDVIQFNEKDMRDELEKNAETAHKVRQAFESSNMPILETLRKSIQTKFDREVDRIKRSTRNATSEVDKELVELTKQSKMVEDLIHRLQEEKRVVDEELRRINTIRRKLFESQSKLCDDLSLKGRKLQEKIDQVTGKFDALKKALVDTNRDSKLHGRWNCEVGKTLIKSAKDMEDICGSLTHVVEVAEHLVAVMVDKMPAFIPCQEMLNVGRLDVQRRYTTADMLKDLQAPDIPSRQWVRRIRHIQPGTTAQLSLRLTAGGKVLAVEDLRTGQVEQRTVTETPAEDMAVLSETLKLLMPRYPNIRVIHGETKTQESQCCLIEPQSESEDDELHNEVSDLMMQAGDERSSHSADSVLGDPDVTDVPNLPSVKMIMTDGEDATFIIHGDLPSRHLVILDASGATKQQTEIPPTYSMAYCRQTNCLLLAGEDTIHRYVWDGNQLTHVVCSPYDVQGFTARDIYVTDRVVYVAGYLNENEGIKVLQSSKNLY